MNEEIKKVLELMEEGKVSKEEATELIEAMAEGNAEKESSHIGNQEASKKRFFRILVDRDGRRIVNLTLPLSFVNFGLKAFKVTGKKTISVDGQEIPFDIDEVTKAINDHDFHGKIVDIDSPEDNTHVEIEIT
jgi:DUF4097 and DUF4098 domain-containing protein YvlB